LVTGHLCHVIKLVGMGKVATADFCCGLVDLDGCDGARPGALKCQREAADTVEQGNQGQGHPATRGNNAMQSGQNRVIQRHRSICPAW
jgi:hypothetical protein